MPTETEMNEKWNQTIFWLQVISPKVFSFFSFLLKDWSFRTKTGKSAFIRSWPKTEKSTEKSELLFPDKSQLLVWKYRRSQKTLIGSVSSRNWITILWSRWKLEPIGIEIILQNCFSTSMQSLILLSGFHYSQVPPILAKTAIFWTDLTII